MFPEESKTIPYASSVLELKDTDLFQSNVRSELIFVNKISGFEPESLPAQKILFEESIVQSLSITLVAPEVSVIDWKTPEALNLNVV